MEWMLVSITVLTIIVLIAIIVVYRRELRKNQQIFEEYLERQRKMKLDGGRAEK